MGKNNAKPKAQKPKAKAVRRPAPVKQVAATPQSKVRQLVMHNPGLKQQTKNVSNILLATILPGDAKSMRLPYQADQKTAVVDFDQRV